MVTQGHSVTGLTPLENEPNLNEFFTLAVQTI